VRQHILSDSMNDSFVNQIYYYDAKLRHALRLLKRYDKVSLEDKCTILEFMEHLRRQGVYIGRLAKYLFHFRVFRAWLGKNLKDASRTI